ncbi:MAG: hypothetical protein FWG10_00570 [Eubacteriaceae bacterium]|nr:hypothetical protein [Eubacteriaceae bacterium]
MGTSSTGVGFHKQLVDDAVRFKAPARVPFIPHFYLWSALDQGYKISDVCTDFELNIKVQRNFHEKYKFDVFKSQSGLLCNPLAILEGIGTGFNVFNDDAESIEIDDFQIMFGHDYDAFLADWRRFLWEVMLPRKFPEWNNLKVSDLARHIGTYREFTSHLATLSEIATKELALPKMNAVAPAFLPVECFYMYWMGLQGASKEVRRNPGKFQDAVALLDKEIIDPFVELVKQGVDVSESAFVTSVTFLAQNFMNSKQFGQYYWPTVKKILDAVTGQDQIMHIFAEGMIIRLADFFRDVEKGHLAIQIEQDSPYDFVKALPNVACIGGVTTHYLGHTPADECVAYVKRLIDDLGTSGGFLLAPDKMMSYRRDAKGENLKAVCDFVAEYWLASAQEV